jgi:hypothetical protein
MSCLHVVLILPVGEYVNSGPSAGRCHHFHEILLLRIVIFNFLVMSLDCVLSGASSILMWEWGESGYPGITALNGTIIPVFDDK